MNDKTPVLQHIADTLDEVLTVLKKPESKIGKVLETAGAAVSILGILSIVDVIKNWIFGG
jgi:hypothetical protein